MTEQRPWLAQYPAGVPETIDVDSYASVVAVIEEAFERFRHRPAFHNFGRTLSYGEVDRLSAQFAAFLQKDLVKAIEKFLPDNVCVP